MEVLFFLADILCLYLKILQIILKKLFTNICLVDKINSRKRFFLLNEKYTHKSFIILEKLIVFYASVSNKAIFK